MNKPQPFSTLGLCIASLVLFIAPFAVAQNAATPAPQAGATAAQSPADTLHQNMRKLWTDHVVWTREFIIAATENPPDVKAVTDRLMKNQEDIGSAVGTVYGDAAGQKLTTLLKEHIAIAADLVKAAKAKDTAKQTQADQKWHKNAQDIADFLSQANPNWPKATLMDLLNMHLSTTADEVNARLKKDWDADVKAFDAVYSHILKMSDALSDGIVKQFPQKFAASAM
jgi:hypothetical protein